MQTHPRHVVKFLFLGVLAALLLGVMALPRIQAQSQPDSFTFAVAADMRDFAGSGKYDTLQYFKGAAQAIKDTGGAAFLISPGDLDPPASVRWTVDEVLGSGYRWLPVVGNHELPGAGSEASSGANMAYLRAYDYGAVHPGPAGCPTTTFSFDYANAHFAVLNEYCDAGGDTHADGDVSDLLYTWLSADLAATHQAHIFVVGHEPAYPQPDEDTGRLRHLGDSLDKHPANRDRFWGLLQAYQVTAYLCGHTHDYSAVQIDRVWQIDSGHARGLGDTGAPSTFVLVQVKGPEVIFLTYRDDMHGGAYTRRYSGTLEQAFKIHLPLVGR